MIYTILRVENGYIVLDERGGMGTLKKQWVFTNEEDLGEWITKNANKEKSE